MENARVVPNGLDSHSGCAVTLAERRPHQTMEGLLVDLGPTVNGGQIETLSRRELEVLRLVASGASNKDIANSLFITQNTVKTHLRRILEKLNLINRSQAAVFAVQVGVAGTMVWDKDVS